MRDIKLPFKKIFYGMNGSTRWRLMLIVGTFIFLVIIRAIERRFGVSLGYVYIILISLAGFWFGMRGGIIAAVVAYLIFIVEFTLLGQWETQIFLMQALLARAFVYVLGGVAFGHFSGIEKNIKKQLELEVEKKTKELIAAQEKLIRAERLAAMGETGGIIAHEFKNHLGTMNNVAYFLKMKLKDSDEKVRKNIDILDRQLMQTNKVIENILYVII